MIQLDAIPPVPALLVGLNAAASLGLLTLLVGLQRVFAVAPRLPVCAEGDPLPAASLTLVIPAYNEAANIEACVRHALACEPPCASWQVVVVDDAGTDGDTSDDFTPMLVAASELIGYFVAMKGVDPPDILRVPI